MNQTATNPYNFCMDFLKGIACIFVVFIHVKFPGNFGQAVQAVARFAVPFFFMVSGYYYYKPDYQGVIGGGKKILHILKITFFAYLFYIVISLTDNLFLGDTKQFDFSLSHLFYVALFSVPSNVPSQLWFMIALLEVYIIYFFVDMLHARTLAYWIAAFTILAMIMLAQGAWLMGYKLGADYYRNAWIEGFSFFTLGYFLHDKQGKLTMSNKSELIIIAVSAVLSIVERFICGRIFVVHMSTYFLVSSLFIYAIKNPKRHEGVVQRIGKKYSMYVYILHMFCWNYFDRFVEDISAGENIVLMWFRPLIVLSFSLLMSMGCYALFSPQKCP